jgi:uroporphyrinogen decarboxylase
MRQAGRYMKEYRELRAKYSMLELCKSPELATQVTLQPIRRFDLDAAIIFADILLPLPGIGVDFEFAVGEGPRIHRPVDTDEEVTRLHVGEPEEALSFVFDALRMVRSELDPEIALIGFAGAPFTIASYMIEGGYSRNFLKTKSLMYSKSGSWQRLMEILAEVTSRYLKAQIEAGAQVVQLFDSWIGALGADDYEKYVLPYSKYVFDSLKEQSVPTIHFGTGTAGFLDLMRKAGGSVQSVDWRIPLDQAWELLGTDVAIQGNLDPAAMMGCVEELELKVNTVLQKAGGRPGHIFNLGHGFFPQTPVNNVEAVINWVHGYEADER